MQEGALTLGGCMWSLIYLYAMGFLLIPCWLCCSSGRGSIGSLSRLTSNPSSIGALTLCNLLAVSLSQWYIYTCKRQEAKQGIKTQANKRYYELAIK